MKVRTETPKQGTHLKFPQILADPTIRPRFLLPGELVQRREEWDGFPGCEECQQIGRKILGHIVSLDVVLKEHAATNGNVSLSFATI